MGGEEKAPSSGFVAADAMELGSVAVDLSSSPSASAQSSPVLNSSAVVKSTSTSARLYVITTLLGLVFAFGILIFYFTMRGDGDG